MTFSFDPNLSDALSKVRFDIGDTDKDGHYLTNETILALLSIGGFEYAVLASIKYIISQLSTPNFSLDWLSVSGMKDAKEGYENLLAEKEKEFGMGLRAGSTIRNPYRADSLQTDSDYGLT